MNTNFNPSDKITVDVPLFIRLLEYAREDAKTDMDLHDLAEKAITLSETGKTLTMNDYDSLVTNIPNNQEMNEQIKRMQQLAGLLNENKNNDPYEIITTEYENTPNEASYNEVLNIIRSWEDNNIINDFQSEFLKGQPISKQEYYDFVSKYSEGGDYIYNMGNWIYIFDKTIYDRTRFV